jgi:GMP synthase-like glutamine amidotransferase
LKIGLSQRILYHKGRAYDSIEHGWYSYLKEHTLFYVPNDLDQDFDLLSTNLDAFIITGGDDSRLRRTVEVKLATKMMEKRKPVIGICHGAFLLTDLLGGKVIEVDAHRDTKHPVLYFGEIKEVNSFHSLGIEKLHDSGTVLCTDELGQVEAWIDGTLAGIVWHPERMENPWIPDEVDNLLKGKIN